MKSARTIVKEAISYYKRYFLFIFLAALIVYGLRYLLQLLSSAVKMWIGLDAHSIQVAGHISSRLYYFLTIMGMAITAAITLPAQTVGVSANRVMLRLYAGKKLAWSDVAVDFRQNGLRFLGISAWSALWRSLWYFAFLIPGIIKEFSYMLAPYLIIEYPDMTVRQALTKSMEITKGYKRRLFGISFFISLPCIVILIVMLIIEFCYTYGTFPFVFNIGFPILYLFIMEPLSLMAFAIAYKDIKKDAIKRGLLEN